MGNCLSVLAWVLTDKQMHDFHPTKQLYNHDAIMRISANWGKRQWQHYFSDSIIKMVLGEGQRTDCSKLECNKIGHSQDHSSSLQQSIVLWFTWETSEVNKQVVQCYTGKHMWEKFVLLCLGETWLEWCYLCAVLSLSELFWACSIWLQQQKILWKDWKPATNNQENMRKRNNCIKSSQVMSKFSIWIVFSWCCFNNVVTNLAFYSCCKSTTFKKWTKPDKMSLHCFKTWKHWQRNIYINNWEIVFCGRIAMSKRWTHQVRIF